MIATMELCDLCDVAARVRESCSELDVNEIVVQEVGARRNVDAVVDDACYNALVLLSLPLRNDTSRELMGEPKNMLPSLLLTKSSATVQLMFLVSQSASSVSNMRGQLLRM